MAILWYLSFAVMGAIPGILMAIFHDEQRVGVAIAGLGAVIGALLSVPGTSLLRIIKYTVWCIILRNAGGVAAHQMVNDSGEQIDQATAESDNVSISDRLLIWAYAPEVPHRGGWYVVYGMIAGGLLGAVVTIHDVIALSHKLQTYVLPLPGSKDPPLSDAVITTLLFIIWGGGLAGLFFAAGYRRMLIATMSFAFVLLLFICISINFFAPLIIHLTMAIALTLVINPTKIEIVSDTVKPSDDDKSMH